MRSGAMTSSTSLHVAACQATIFWAKTSTTNDTYTNPAHVRQYVKSMTQVRFGAQAVKSRFSRSPARRPSLPGIV